MSDEFANDPFGRARPPDDFSTDGRVRLLGQAFTALMRGEMPSPQARIFLAAGGMAWLREGGDLTRDFWRVVTPKSHRTAARIWQEVGEPHPDERQIDDDGSECDTQTLDEQSP